MKKRTSFTLLEESLEILARLAKKRGIYQSTLLDVLLREEDQRERAYDRSRAVKS
jgi:hypothetical protein